VKTIRIGGGAGFSGDRIEPAVDLARRGRLDYLVFECLAERTIALAQQARSRDPEGGFDPLLAPRMEAVLPACREHGVTIVTNMGAANPRAAGAAVAAIARRLGLGGLRIATVSGDDVLGVVARGDFVVAETGAPVAAFGDRLLSANAYIGAEPLIAALAGGADVVITGRAADPALFVAPLAHAFAWRLDDWTALGRGTLVGHMLECAGQVTGGYFADPGCKDIDGLSQLGFPIAEVPEEGPIVITKLEDSGGAVTAATCKEQLLYEIHDPAAYFTPDVIADFSQVRVSEIARHRVALDGAAGRPRPELLKVSLGFRDGYIGEGQIAYGGAGAVGRARLAARVVEERLAMLGFAAEDVRADVIGLTALHGSRISAATADPYEVRVRVAARAASAADAQKVGNEVEALYTNGPAGGGGATKGVREVVSVASSFVPRSLVSCTVNREVV